MSTAANEQVVASKGFFPVVVGRDIQIEQAGGLVYVAKQDIRLTQGGGQWLIAGRDQTVQQGGGAILLSRRAQVSRSAVGVLIAGSVTFEQGARALVTLSLPVAAAAVAGFALGVLVGRRRQAEPPVPAAL